MNRTTIMILISCILILSYISRKKIKKVLKLTRGYRNNNPGNIRLTFDGKGKKILWQGEIEGTDKSFKTFKNMFYGYRAIFVTLNSYFKGGFNTIEKIINRYAPSNENHTESYISTVEKRTGLSRNKILSEDDKIKIVGAISFVENGIEPDTSEIYQGYDLFKYS